MVMNGYILLFVSLPEAILNIIIFLLFAGKKESLKINKPNAIRFVITLGLMLASSAFIRPKAPNVAVNMCVHLIAYVAIIVIVYKINIQYAFLSVGLAMLTYSTVENAYTPYVIVYLLKGMENFPKEYLMFPIYSLPIRISQLIVIWFLWKHEILLVTKMDKRFHTNFIFTTLILILVEYFFVFIFYTYYEIMPLHHQIVFSIALCVMAIAFNLLIFKLVYNAVYGIVKKSYTYYSELEDNVRHAFNEIRRMLKDNNVEEAIKLIDELNGKEIQVNSAGIGGEKE